MCKNSSLANLSQTITMLGLLAGNIIFGYLSDKFGRRYPLIAGIILQLVVGIATAFVPWYPLFAVFRFLSGIALGGNMLVSYVFMMEIIGVKWRTTFAVAFHIPFDVGYMVLPLISYFFRDWRDLQLAITIPTALLLLSFFILSESPRWLIATGKRDKAIEILTKAAIRNKLPTASIEENVDKYMQKAELETKRKAGNVVDLFKTPITRFYIISMCINWLISGLCYYGSGLYIGQLGGDIFINVAISGGLSIPGNCFAIWSVKAWGRKWSLIFGYLVGSISCLLIAIVPSEPTWIKTILGGIDMFGLIIAFSAIYIYVGELFPTYLRNVGAGTSSMFARIGSMVAPFVLPLSDVAEWLPPLIFGVAPLIALAFCYQLPETIDCQLPDTIEEAEEFAKNQSKKKYFSKK